jgi:hypothetical protein
MESVIALKYKINTKQGEPHHEMHHQQRIVSAAPAEGRQHHFQKGHSADPEQHHDRGNRQ